MRGWKTRNWLRRFGHIERMEKELVKVYLSSSVKGPNRKGCPLRRWKDRVKEYVSEKGARGDRSEWAKRKHMDRRWSCLNPLLS